MAGRLAASGFPLVVWNRTSSRAASLPAAGAELADSPSALAARCDVVITMLSDAAAHGVEFLDAPVSGSVSVAEQGALTVMAGGPADAFERARPVLAVLSKAQLHLGPSGAGAAMKLAVYLVVAATNQSIAEALTLAGVSGIDAAAAYDALAASAVSSLFLGYKRRAYLRPDGAPVSFTAALMSKDLELAIGVAGGVPLPVTAAAKEFLDATCAAGFGDADFASVARVLRDQASLG